MIYLYGVYLLVSTIILYFEALHMRYGHFIIIPGYMSVYTPPLISWGLRNLLGAILFFALYKITAWI